MENAQRWYVLENGRVEVVSGDTLKLRIETGNITPEHSISNDGKMFDRAVKILGQAAFQRASREASENTSTVKLDVEPISMPCPECGTTLKTNRKYLGRKGQCAKCGTKFIIQDQGVKQPVSQPERVERDRLEEPRPVLVEQTSKKWKMLQLIGFGIAGLGFLIICIPIWFVANGDNYTTGLRVLNALGIGACATGLLVGIFGGIMAWWNHG